jgi:maltooligosyltrehalose trehalohydrolase
VWAPFVQKAEVHIVSPQERVSALEKDEHGYHRGMLDGVEPGSLYFFRLDDEKDRPDPASRFQPEGVHGPSQVVDCSFFWRDEKWTGLSLTDYVFYELHVGAFTPEGTFEAIIQHLDYLVKLGITAVELMPVAQFPGDYNWGYDGTYPFAVHDTYGGPQGLKGLVNACHERRLAVVLDVVYNHLGPEGNYLGDFGPYFTDRYLTPWGSAVNFDGAHSDEVRRFFIENALYWIKEFHVDSFRIDAVHGILDFSAKPFLEQLSLTIHEQGKRLGRQVYLVAESDLNDTRVVRHRERGGYGLDAQWNDDFHHALHTLMTGERSRYYQDFGRLEDLSKAFREGFVYSGEYSRYRGRRHGRSSRNLPVEKFVVFAQNHDQVGNRIRGERLSELVSFEGLKLTAGVVLLSPFLPLLFMGEEYGEKAPFPYFVNHSDPAIIEAVCRGRREQFAAFEWTEEPPDPQDEATFLSAKLNHHLRNEGRHRVLALFHGELIHLRKQIPTFIRPSKNDMDVVCYESEKILLVRRWRGNAETAVLFHFGSATESVTISLPRGAWRKRLDSADRQWQGPGSLVSGHLVSDGEMALTLPPCSFVLLETEQET